MRSFEPRHQYLAVETLLDFFRVRALQEEFDGFLEICQRLLNRRSLAGYVEFGTQGNIQIALFLQ